MKLAATSGTLRVAALIALPAGALGSVGLTLGVGHRNDSRILVLLFAGWVLSPFIAAAWGSLSSRRWPASAQAAFHGAAVVLALGSLAAYGIAVWGDLRVKPALPFLVVPLVSWVLIAAFALILRLRRGGMKAPGPPQA